MIWDYEIRENFESLVDERTYMQENRSDHRPKKPVSGFLADDSSDSDTDSMVSMFLHIITSHQNLCIASVSMLTRCFVLAFDRFAETIRARLIVLLVQTDPTILLEMTFYHRALLGRCRITLSQSS